MTLATDVPGIAPLDRFSMYAAMGLVRVMEPETEALMRERADKLLIDDEYDSPHARSWNLSFHASQVSEPGDGCQRQLAYRMMNFPATEAMPPWVTTTGEVGKAQALDCAVMTASGPQAMGDIQIDDLVLAPDGSEVRVLAVTDHPPLQLYEVIFSDGSSTECCEDHLWQVHTEQQKTKGYPSKIKPLKDLIGDLQLAWRPSEARWYIDLVQRLDMEHEDRRCVPPYLLGALLGDGCITRTASFSTVDLEMIERLTEMLPAGVTAKPDGSRLWRFSGDVTGRKNPLMEDLRMLGLMGTNSGTKFIPEQYLIAPFDDRLALLQGLVDTDGYINGAHIEYTTISDRLAHGVDFLVKSLGGACRMRSRITTYTHQGLKKKGKPSWRLTISLPKGLDPCRLTRKLVNYQRRQDVVRAIASIEPSRVEFARCLTVEGGLYVTDDFIVTHNSGELDLADAWFKGGRLLAIPEDPTHPEIHQLGFVDHEHWMTASTDLPILPKGWRRPHIVEIKGKASTVVDEMLNGRLIQKMDGTLEKIGRGPDARHISQLKATMGLANRYDWGWVTVCAKCWFITSSEVYERLGLKGGAHPLSDDYNYCPRCEDYESEHFQLEPPTTGEIYYWSRDWPRTTKSFYYEHDPSFIEGVFSVLREIRDHFIADEIPPRPDHFQWSSGPCQFCAAKPFCRLDSGLEPRKRKPRPELIRTKLTESAGVDHARSMRPHYDPHATRARVFEEWQDAD